ncbi:MAG: hypothetical protein ACM3S1_11240 [Hyphomicrobiales bacterium]
MTNGLEVSSDVWRSRIPLTDEQLRDFARKWRITRMGLVGDILTEGYGPESEVEIVVSFEPGAPWSLLDVARMQAELADLIRHENTTVVQLEALAAPDNPHRSEARARRYRDEMRLLFAAAA